MSEDNHTKETHMEAIDAKAVVDSTNFLQTIEQDLLNFWVQAQGFVVTDAKVIWDLIRVIIKSELPTQYVIIIGLLNELALDLATADIADIETSLLMKAEMEEFVWIADVGSQILQAIIALVKAQLAAKTKG